jgi:hypothetical protein
MSTLKVDNIQSFSGGDVTLNGNLDVTGIISGDGSGLTNVPGGGGSDLSSYTGSINQSGGSITLAGDFNLSTFGGSQSVLLDGGGLSVNGSNARLNGGATIPYINGGQKNIQVQLSGSNQNYTVGGFDFGGKSYGQIYSNAIGGFQIVDAGAAGTFSSVNLQSDNGSVQIRTNTTGSDGGIINTITGTGAFRAVNNNSSFVVYGGGTGLGMGVSNRSGGPGVPFGGNIDSSYGVNIYNSSDFSQDTALTLNLDAATGTGRNKIGIFSNFGAPGYGDIMSWQDANNYTDGALQVHQILKVDGTNNAPGHTLEVKDGTGTSRLMVNNAAIKAFFDVDVIVNGIMQVDNTITFPAIGNYPNDGDAAAGGVPLRGVYHHNGDLKIRLV